MSHFKNREASTRQQRSEVFGMELASGYFLSAYTIVCTILAFVVPFAVYKINEKIHMKLDPPWKQEDRLKADKKQQQ